MNIDDVIHDFAVAGNDLPVAAIRWSLEDWHAALPCFRDMLQRYADGADRSKDAANALFFIIHLIGEKRETSAFPLLCRLLKDAEASETILHDAITENLRGILISAYDGDAIALQDLIESAGADQFVRAAALEALVYLAARGALHEDAIRAYLLRLFAEMEPRDESFIWSVWAMSAANLGYGDFADKVDELCGRGFIDRTDMGLSDFKTQLRRTLDDPERMAGFAYDRVAPFEDTIGTLSGWYGFSEQYKIDQARRAARALPPPGPIGETTHVNFNRHVGRNDPCPCGSGKKFKKCCLNADAA